MAESQLALSIFHDVVPQSAIPPPFGMPQMTQSYPKVAKSEFDTVL
jgi:hypothetical protein